MPTTDVIFQGTLVGAFALFALRLLDIFLKAQDASDTKRIAKEREVEQQRIEAAHQRDEDWRKFLDLQREQFLRANTELARELGGMAATLQADNQARTARWERLNKQIGDLEVRLYGVIASIATNHGVEDDGNAEEPTN